jgi:hypothetical protein
MPTPDENKRQKNLNRTKMKQKHPNTSCDIISFKTRKAYRGEVITHITFVPFPFQIPVTDQTGPAVVRILKFNHLEL